MTKILDGKALVQTMQGEIALQVADFRANTGQVPGLAAVLVGDDPASQVYVRNKQKACEKVGIASWLHQLPSSTTQAELLDLVAKLNADPRVSGILVQLPLPRHIDEDAIIAAVDPLKDVDGFGPTSLGLLTAGKPRYYPCTPLGVQQILARNQIPIEGRHVVIVGRSNIVGKPLALILMQKAKDANATVTVCHSRSQNLAEITRQGDIVVMAIGVAKFLKADMIKQGAVVIDVGTNRGPDGKLVGDVDFDAVAPRASAITPVPGGIGPMTITMLLHNTLAAATIAFPPRAM